MGFPRQEYWAGLPFPSPVDLSDPGIKLGTPALQADALFSEPPRKPEGHSILAGAYTNCNIEHLLCVTYHVTSLCVELTFDFHNNRIG